MKFNWSLENKFFNSTLFSPILNSPIDINLKCLVGHMRLIHVLAIGENKCDSYNCNNQVKLKF
jgi:hypothetical protein